MVFWERFVRLCMEKGKSPNGIAKEIGLSSGSVTAWKNGKTPHATTLHRIADYFSVTVDYLLGKTEETKKAPVITDEDIKFALFGGEREVTDEMYDEVKQFAAFVKAKHGKK